MKQGLVKIVILTLLLTMVMGFGTVNVFAEENGPTLVLDGSVLETPDPPVIRNSRTLLPAKILFEEFDLVFLGFLGQ